MPCANDVVIAQLGACTYKIDSRENTLHVWDRLGVAAYGKRTHVQNIRFQLGQRHFKTDPESTFSGELIIDGQRVTDSTTPWELRDIGFTSDSLKGFRTAWSRNIGAFRVSAVFDEDNKIEDVSISYSGDKVTAQLGR